MATARPDAIVTDRMANAARALCEKLDAGSGPTGDGLTADNLGIMKMREALREATQARHSALEGTDLMKLVTGPALTRAALSVGQ